MARSKKWWAVHVSAGVATALLILFGITKCSGEKDERNAKEAAQEDLLKAAQHIENVAARVDSLVVINCEQEGTIKTLNDSIVVLNDSLVRVNGKLVRVNDELEDVRGRLADCEKSRKATKPVVKPCPCEKQEKPQPKPEVKPKPQPKPVVVEQKKEQPAPVAKPCQPSKPAKGTTETKIEVSGNSQNPGNIVVANSEQGAGNTTITITDGSCNSGTIVVSNGGTVNVTTGNANAGKSGCPAKQTVDTTVQQVQQQKRAAAAYVYVRRVTYTK